MKRHQRQRPAPRAPKKAQPVERRYANAGTAIEEILALVLGDTVAPHVVVGPVLWQPDAAGSRRWYFIAASGDPDSFRINSIDSGADQALAADMRAGFMATLAQRGPVVIHDLDDELHMARLCEAIWPGAKAQRIREGVERERSMAGSDG